MLILLCLLVARVKTAKGLIKAMEDSKQQFYAMAVQSGVSQHEADEFIRYVVSDSYGIAQWKNLCASYIRYMTGEREEGMWDGSDWFSNWACEEGTSRVCEFSESTRSKYCGPKRKAA